MIPMRLTKGDTIGIVSPSSPVTVELEAQFEKGIQFLKDLGFKTVIGKYVFSTAWGYAASPKEKADDINRMFADESIKAIICSQGGATSNGCLSYINWDVIRTNPKIFLGISDITILLNAVYQKTGLATFHGNDLMWGFGRNPSEYDKQEFIRRFIDADIGLIQPNQERKTVRSGIAEGRLLGGNINCLLKLSGTPYWPDFNDAILFIEAVGIKSEDCDQMFHHLGHMGVFDQINGVVIGYIDGLQNNKKDMIQMEDVFLRITAEYKFPIMKSNDFGHNCPNTVLPVGGKVKLDAGERTIEILDKCVK